MTPASQPILDVLICTFGPDALARVAAMQLPAVAGVRYLVSWQMPPQRWELPEALRRDDVEVYTSDTRGLGRNRNIANALATAPLCLVADDDLRYRPEGLLTIISTFLSHPDLDVALFRHATIGGEGRPKPYPHEAVDLGRRLPRGYYVTSFEMAFRRDSVVGKVRFPERFGIGTDLPSAEESIFFLECRRRGLRCRFFPYTIVRHAGPTTGSRPASQGVMRAEGAYLRRAYPLTGILRAPLFAFRAYRAGRAPLWPGIAAALRGFLFTKIE